MSHRVKAPPSQNNHRSVKAEHIPFVGWNRLEGIVEKARQEYGLEVAALIATLFTGGFRISEVVETHHSSYPEPTGLKPSNFDVDEPENIFEFVDVTIQKKYEKVSGSGYVCHQTGPHTDNFGRLRSGLWDDPHKHYQTERRIGEEVKRSAPVPLDERFIPVIREYSRAIDKDKFLFPFNRQKAWRFILGVDPSTWPHWFRSQRASQLGASKKIADPDKRGYGFNDRALQDWFRWTSGETSKVYAHRSTDELRLLFPSRL